MKTNLQVFIETLPKELQNIPAVFHAPYGFKLIEIGDKKTLDSGTFEDYQRAEATRLKVDPSTIKQKDLNGCGNSSPTSCAGGCAFGECGGEIVAGYVYCSCVS